MKLWAMLCRVTQDRWVMVESSDKMRSTGEGNGKPLQYSCLEKPVNENQNWINVKKKIKVTDTENKQVLLRAGMSEKREQD